jgi:hypothetical protein
MARVREAVVLSGRAARIGAKRILLFTDILFRIPGSSEAEEGNASVSFDLTRVEDPSLKKNPKGSSSWDRFLLLLRLSYLT